MASKISGGMERMDVVGRAAAATLSAPEERRRMIVFSVTSSGDMTASDACMSAEGAIVSRESLVGDIILAQRVQRWA